MAFAKSKAREGDREAQAVYDQLAFTQEVSQMLEHLDQQSPVVPVAPAPTSIADSPMEGVSEEEPKPDLGPGEQAEDEGTADDRKRIRSALEQAVDSPGNASEAASSSSSGATDSCLRPKAKAKTQPESQE
eukprot:5654930-Amphidinium_carterae.2